MNEENVVVDNSNTTEEVVLDTTEYADDSQNTSETLEEVKARLAKAEEVANNYKVRAEKAERKAKETVRTENTEKPISLSTKDLYALVEAKVAEEDISEVEEFAKFKGITIAEALKTSTVRSLLNERKENRQVAQASNTGTARRSSTRISDDSLAERASKGDLPDSQDDMIRLIKARKGIK